MPLSRRIDPQNRFLRTTISSPINLRDIENHLNIVFGVGVEACPELIDAREVESGALSVREVMVTLRHFGLGREQFAPRAVVVSSETFFAIARIVSTLVCGWVRVGVFYDPDVAREWLTSRMSPVGMEAWRSALSKIEMFELSETA